MLVYQMVMRILTHDSFLDGDKKNIYEWNPISRFVPISRI